MATLDLRASKSTNFLRIVEIVRGVPGGAGQAAQTGQLMAGGGKIAIPVAVSGSTIGWEECKVYSRFGVKFDIDFTGMTSITSATLNLWSWNSGTLVTNGFAPQQGATTLAIGSMPNDWAEYGLGIGGIQGTYQWRKNYSGGNTPWGWAAIPSIGSRTDREFTCGAAGTLQQFNVLDIVNAWYGGQANYGFGAIFNGGEIGWDFATAYNFSFYSCDNTTSAAYVPQLVIEYTTNTAPRHPINMFPTGGQILSTSTPIMGFTHDDNDAGEYIRGSCIQVISADAATPDVANWDQWFYNTYSYSWPGMHANFTYGTLPGSINRPLIPGRDYKWRALTMDMAGVSSPWSPMNDFRINGAPNAPEISIETYGSLEDLMTLNPRFSFGFSDSDPYDKYMHGYRVWVEESDQYLNWKPAWDSGPIDVTGGPDLVVNGNFHTGITSWVVNDASSSVWLYNGGVDGAGCLQTIGDGTGTEYVTQDVAVSAGSTYNLAAYIWANAASTAQTHIEWRTAVAKISDSTVLSNDATVNAWVPLNTNFVAPATATIARITLKVPNNSTSQARWDYVALRLASTTSSTINVTVVCPTLKWGTDYRVKAQVRDSIGTWSSDSTWKYFQTHKTQEPINMSPLFDEPVSYKPRFFAERYQAPDEIESYRMWVYDVSTGQDMVTRDSEFSTGINNKTTFTWDYVGAQLTAGNRYGWRCKIYSAIGGWSEDSAQMTFVVYDPTTPTHVAPIGDAEYNLTPTIVVSREATFNRVQYQIYPEFNFTNSEGVDDLGVAAIYSSPYISTGITAKTGGNNLYTGNYWEYSQVYGGTPPLNWAYQPAGWDGVTPRPGHYMIRSRVSADGGVNWTPWNGLQFWKTDTAAIPYPYSVAGDTDPFPWITDDTPTFVVRSSNPADTISKIEITLYNINNLYDEFWNSGFVDVTDGLEVSLTFNGTGNQALVPGNKYAWRARMEEDTGARSDYSRHSYFRLNGPPYIPTNIYPANGAVIDTSIPFRIEATFSDPDMEEKHDYPTYWDVELYNDNGSPYDIEYITGGLVAGHNSMLWTGDQPVNEYYYQIRMRFRDSKGAIGPWSAWNRFVRSTPPDGDIISPTNGSTIDTTTPIISFDYDDGTGNTVHKLYHIFHIYETDSNGNWLWPVASLGPYYNNFTMQVIPAGYMQDGKYYEIILWVANDKGMQDPTWSSVNVRVVLDAPPAITGLDAVAYRDASRIQLGWNQTWVKPYHTFIGYRIYRKKWYEKKYREIAFLPNITWTGFHDYYAGNSINYNYKVVGVTSKAGIGTYLESPDDPNRGNLKIAQNATDNWTLVGNDRAAGHIYDMIVNDESHTRPIQQEEFETLGADRKTIIRGFVLGHEGTLSTIWQNRDDPQPGDAQEKLNHTQIGRDLIDYITYHRGPHIVKSPFGDVWDVQFLDPEYRWLPAGDLQIDLRYIETGTTSAEGES